MYFSRFSLWVQGEISDKNWGLHQKFVVSDGRSKGSEVVGNRFRIGFCLPTQTILSDDKFGLSPDFPKFYREFFLA